MQVVFRKQEQQSEGGSDTHDGTRGAGVRKRPDVPQLSARQTSLGTAADPRELRSRQKRAADKFRSLAGP